MPRKPGKRVEPGVTVYGSRFTPVPHQYIVKDGDGTARYQTREEALEAYDAALEAT